MKSVDDWSSSSCNPYLFNAEEIKPKPASGASKFKSRDEKYAEDILRLHEAYQVFYAKYFSQGSLIVWLTSCLTGLDSTKQVNMLIILKLQSNWAFSEWSIYDSVYQLGLFVRDLYIEASCYDCMFCLQMLCYKSNRSSLELNKIFGNYRSIKFNFFVLFL